MSSLLTYYRNYLNDNSGNQGGQGGLILPATSFSDTLQTADPLNNNGGLLRGDQWMFGMASPGTNNGSIDFATYSIGASTKDGLNALLWSIVGPNNPFTGAASYLLPVTIFLSCYGVTQFAQCTLVTTSTSGGSNIMYCGLTVMCNPSNTSTGFQGYIFIIKTDKSWSLQRWGSGSSAMTSGGAGSINDGDIFRLSVTVSPSQNVVTVLKNGVAFTTYTDNTSSRLKLGSPGMCSVVPSTAGGSYKSDWRTFSAGIGT